MPAKLYFLNLDFYENGLFYNICFPLVLFAYPYLSKGLSPDKVFWPNYAAKIPQIIKIFCLKPDFAFLQIRIKLVHCLNQNLYIYKYLFLKFAIGIVIKAIETKNR